MVYKKEAIRDFLMAIPFVAIYLSTAGFFIFWQYPSLYINFLLFIFCFLFFVFCSYNRKVEALKLQFSFLVSILFFLIVVPIRPHDVIGMGSAFSLLLLLTLLLEEKVLRKISATLVWIAAFSSASALIVFVVNLIGFDLPWYKLDVDFRANKQDFYRVYLGSVVLSDQIWSISSGHVLRTSGLLREPGHFAMLCAGLLLMHKFNFSDFKLKLIAIGGGLTMSPAYLLILSIGYLFTRRKTASSVVISIVVVIAAISSSFVLIDALPERLQDRIVFNNIERLREGGVTKVIAERSRGGFNNVYEQAPFEIKLLGGGYGYLTHMGYPNALDSGYRGFVLEKGYISVLILFLFLSLILYVSKANGTIKSLIVMFVLIIFLHRSWMLLQPWLYFMLAYSCMFNRVKV